MEEKSRELAIAQGAIVTELSQEEKQKFREAVGPVYKKYCGQYMDRIEEIIEYGK